ncbi:hypothetical protein BS78_K313800 [Paspalum vaginatum]|uniref:NB-ARC domain-containing protein n=1 Tax=Paspalum vaginatum TaxID=158149 RepID=A0A9W7XD72_9POAL|nr:hypothetical protein BS78_K313800 [Paspalum vaginatum]KAJ1256775.1 hypothetical protein BS78_K313800 [Paspalum vaginatum]KAJ1256776.1 hypothetical protein BS78_K313800 [Paspalum vaginatum]
MEVPCSASLGAMGSLLRKFDGLLHVIQPEQVDEIWKPHNLSTRCTSRMQLWKVFELSLESDYLLQGQLRTDNLKKLEELLHAEDIATSLKQLRDGLKNISTKLEKLSEVNDSPLSASYWIKDARELSYRVEDFVDKLFIHSDKMDDTIPWMDEISGFNTRVEEMLQQYDRYKLEYVLSDPAKPAVNYHLQRLRGKESKPIFYVGIEEPTNELLELVKPKDNGEDELKVVSILGDEGVGKTTLAKRLWHQLGVKFDCRAFVQTAKKPDTRMVLKSILTQIHPKQPPVHEPCEVANLIQCLRKDLQDKRYFIIIDDIWAISVWDVISCAFPEVNCCSRILTTTTIEDVALACCSYEPDHVFSMKPLDCCHSKKLFVDRAFGSGNRCPPQFNTITDEITRKCGGLPLAIICLATLIENQLQLGLGRQLEQIQNFLNHNLRTNQYHVEILTQVLNLCYSSLPQCLKTCLLYLSVYPENYLIRKDDLVKQWIAEDFISRTEADNVEAANCFFDELVSLGLIQRMDISFIKELSYVVHPMVFEFIKCKSMEENFITIIDYHSQSTLALTDKIRRLSLHFGSATYATTPASIGVWQVRSLAFMGLLNCMPSLVDFKLARVVILHVLVDNGDMRFSLAEICKLLLLRYLQVICNVTVELPDQMGCLKYLETLDIHAAVLSVPSDIVQLPRLLHLFLGRKRDCYRKHRFLSYLPSGRARSIEDSSRASSYHVQTYEFLGMIQRPPPWIGHFRNLRYLDAVLREIQTYEVDVLAELWALTILSLYVRTPTAGGIRFKRAVFPALRHLTYKCGGVTLLNFESGAMPNLWTLSIGLNAQRGEKYGHMLAGIQHLQNLQEVSASIGAAFGADESDRRAAESTLQDAISKHPCLLSLKVERFDGEYEPSEKNWVQEIEQDGAHKDEFSNDQPGVLVNLPGKDMKNVDTSDEQNRTEALKKAQSVPLWFATIIAAVAVLIYAARFNPSSFVIAMSHVRCKASFYCNAFLASMAAIIVLLRKRVQFGLNFQSFCGLVGAFHAWSYCHWGHTALILWVEANLIIFVLIFTSRTRWAIKTGNYEAISTHRKIKEANNESIERKHRRIQGVGADEGITLRNIRV